MLKNNAERKDTARLEVWSFAEDLKQA